MTHGDSGVQALVEFLGETDAAIVIEKLGGIHFRVPTHSNGIQYQRLESALGTALADRVVEKFHGEELYIPFNSKQKTKDKHEHVVSRFKYLCSEGVSNTDAIIKIALETKTSRRQIQRIIYKH